MKINFTWQQNIIVTKRPLYGFKTTGKIFRIVCALMYFALAIPQSSDWTSTTQMFIIIKLASLKTWRFVQVFFCLLLVSSAVFIFVSSFFLSPVLYYFLHTTLPTCTLCSDWMLCWCVCVCSITNHVMITEKGVKYGTSFLNHQLPSLTFLLVFFSDLPPPTSSVFLNWIHVSC